VVAHSSDDLRVDVIAANLTGEPLPDLIWGNQDDLAELIIDEQLQPVDQFYQVQPDQFLPALLTGATRDGQLWGLPLAGQDSLLLLYNRALLSQPPDTTDELIVATRAFEGPDTYGIAAPWTEPRWLLAWLNGYGGSLTTSDGERPSLHTPQMVDALNLLLELQNAAPPDQQSYVESRAAFAAGQVAFMVDGAWSVPAYQSAAIAPDLGIAPMPVVPATGQRAASALRGIYLMAPASLSGTSLEQARSFATYLTTPAVQQRIAGTSGRLPALQAAMTDPAIQNDPVRAAAAAQAGAAAGIPPTRGARCALAAMQIWLDPLLVGEIDQQEAAEAMQQEAERCLAR
jgi:ABC-type glycerol-3-phosphate transport system substrate-binding protein